MTQGEAFAASAEQLRPIKHRYFSKDEYMQVFPDGKIVFEDGVSTTIEFFNYDRKGAEWKQGWDFWN